MNVEEINHRVETIRLTAGGDEDAAHAMEDQLYVDVLKAIAQGAWNADDLAKAALKSREFDFVRHTG